MSLFTPSSSDPEGSRSASGEKGRIGSFEIIRELGRGGQGVVYLVRDERLNRFAALKLLSSLAASSDRALERFQREARLLSSIDDPGICSVYEVGSHAGAPWIAMRYVPGRTLASLVEETQKIGTLAEPSQFIDFLSSLTTDEPDAEGRAETLAPTHTEAEATATSSQSPDRAAMRAMVKLVERVARSLGVAHAAGITHRDIKPANVMVTPEGLPVILDFGLARALDEDSAQLTQSGDQMGTPAYMAPEQIRGEIRRIGPATDVFALGVLAFEALTRTRPFAGATREALYRAILEQEVPSVRGRNRSVPKDLEVIIQCALEKDPHRRYQTGSEFADDLARFLKHEPVAARRIGPIGRTLRWAHRHPAPAALLSLALIVTPLLTGLLVDRAANRTRVLQQERLELERAVERLLAEGFGAISHGRRRQAVRVFEEAIQRLPEWGEGYAGLAIAYMTEGDYAEAERSLKRSPQEFPGFDAVRAQILERAGDHAGAQAIRERMAPPRTAIDHFLRGQLALAEGHRGGFLDTEAQTHHRIALRHFEAAALLSTRARLEVHTSIAHAFGHLEAEAGEPPVIAGLIALWPEEAESHRWASFALHQQNPERALELLEGALQRSSDPVLHEMRAALLGILGRREESRAIYQRLISDNPDAGPHLQLRIAASFSSEARLVEALAVTDEVLSKHEGNREALTLKANLLTKLQRFDEARPLIQKALELSGSLNETTHDRSNLYIYLGTGHFAQGRVADALAQYDFALQQRGQHPVAHFYRGECLEALGRKSEAEAAWRASIEAGRLTKDPISGPHRSLGLRAAKAGDWQLALSEFRSAIAVDPKDALAQYFFGTACLNLEEFTSALKAFEVSCDLMPEHAESWCNRAHAHFGLGETKPGVLALCEGLRRARNLPRWPYPTESQLKQKSVEESQRLREAGHYAEALEILQPVVALIEDSSTLWKELAAVHAAAGDPSAAATAWRRALALRGDSKTALLGLATALEALGEGDEELVATLRKLLDLLEDRDQPGYSVSDLRARLKAAQSKL